MSCFVGSYKLCLNHATIFNTQHSDIESQCKVKETISGNDIP